nr:hypothetical protein RSP597_25785 [Ralstonia solanacearum]
MITQFGMSEQLGLATYEEMPNLLFSCTGWKQRERKEYGEATAQMIDADVRKALGKCKRTREGHTGMAALET